MIPSRLGLLKKGQRRGVQAQMRRKVILNVHRKAHLSDCNEAYDLFSTGPLVLFSAARFLWGLWKRALKLIMDNVLFILYIVLYGTSFTRIVGFGPSCGL